MDAVQLRGRNVLVIGLGKTGVATAQFLASRGARVSVSEEKQRSAVEDGIARIADIGAVIEVGGHNPCILSGVDLIIPSPGVPPHNPLIAEGVKKGIPVMSEMELASRFMTAPVIAITGTNGKTTTTTLVGALLAHDGYRVFVGGNIGNPLIAAVNGNAGYDWAVVEVSSFQLLWTERFCPSIAILLNISADHMDYHGSFDEYRTMKERIFSHQSERDLAIINADDPRADALAAKLRAPVTAFSSSRFLEDGICIDGGDLRFHGADGSVERYPLAGIRLRGTHNLENIMASIVAARRAGCGSAGIIESLKIFPGLPHRIEHVGSWRGIDFYDDSKGTNVDAVRRAVESFAQPVILLMGGRDKGGDFAALAPIVREKVKRLVLFGESRDTIYRALGTFSVAARYERLADAVEAAIAGAASGDVVLLSPGCASFDAYRNYEERGDHFRETVRRITGGLAEAQC